LIRIPERDNAVNSGPIRNARDLGAWIRQRRTSIGLTQAGLADVAGVGVRFISELERGKPTAEVGKVLHVAGVLGLDLHIGVRPGGNA